MVQSCCFFSQSILLFLTLRERVQNTYRPVNYTCMYTKQPPKCSKHRQTLRGVCERERVLRIVTEESTNNSRAWHDGCLLQPRGIALPKTLLSPNFQRLPVTPVVANEDNTDLMTNDYSLRILLRFTNYPSVCKTSIFLSSKYIYILSTLSSEFTYCNLSLRVPDNVLTSLFIICDTYTCVYRLTDFLFLWVWSAH